MIDGPVRPASGATRCQISSVTKGIIGWMRRSTASSTRTRVRRVPRSLAGSASGSVRTVLESSRYQSQYSFQVKS